MALVIRMPIAAVVLNALATHASFPSWKTKKKPNSTIAIYTGGTVRRRFVAIDMLIAIPIPTVVPVWNAHSTFVGEKLTIIELTFIRCSHC